MAKTDLNIIKNWFKTGLKPTQAQFWTTWDSFWHKDEKLPISSIENLGNILDNKAENNHLHNEYATNDATSLNEENVSSWRNSLGITEIELTDEAVKLTNSYEEFGIEVGSSQNLLNQTFVSELFNKVEIPEENADADHVLLADGSTLAKTEFGSNSTVMGIAPDENKNIDISNVAMDWKNPSQKFSGLQDKSNDGTFNEFALFDKDGNIAKATKAIHPLMNLVKQLTTEEALEFSRYANGGVGSPAAIDVASISPKIFQLEDNNVTLLLEGGGLALNELDFSIRICDINGNFLDTIPNGQVTFINDNRLTFYYNYYHLGIGDYKFLITSGVKTLLTSSIFKIVEAVDYLDTNSITWERITKDNYDNPNTIASGANVSYRNEGEFIRSSDIQFALKSSELFPVGTNFLIECKLTFNTNGYGNGISPLTQIGLCYSNVTNALAYYNLSFVGLSDNWGGVMKLVNNNIEIGGNIGIGYTAIFNIIKEGNMVYCFLGTTLFQISIANNSGYSLAIQVPQRDFLESWDLTILKAYKFN